MTQAVAEVRPDWRIGVTGDERLQSLAMNVPGARWDPRAAQVTTPLSWAACLALRGVFQELLDVGPRLAAWAAAEKAARVDPAMAVRGAVRVTGMDGGWYDRLLEFQKPGVAFIAIDGKVLLADDMGTGKTVQAIAGLRRLHEAGRQVLPALIVVPNGTQKAWERHWHDWWGEPIRVQVVGDTGRKTPATARQRGEHITGGADVLIMNWEQVMLHSRLAPHGSIRMAKCPEHGGLAASAAKCEVHPKELNGLGLRTVVADEVHRMRNVNKTTRAMWAVQHDPSVDFRIGLTGTPIGAHPGDLWAVMHGICPEEWPTKSGHEKRYCLQAWTIFGRMDIIGIQPAARAEFFGFFDPRFRRMPKDLVAPFLPPVVRERRDSPMTPAQRRAYSEMAEHAMFRDEQGRLCVAPSDLAAQTRLSQLAAAVCEVTPEGVRLTAKSPKLDAMVAAIEEAGDQSVVVCADHRQLIELAAERLEKEGVSHRVLVGGMTQAQIDAHVQDLQEKRVRVLLFTIKAGGTGLTMTTASVMIRLQRSWSMIENEQAEARIHRIGSEQHERITLVDVVTPGTVEVGQLRALRKKFGRLQEIARDAATLAAGAPDMLALEAERRAILESTLTEGLDEEETA